MSWSKNSILNVFILLNGGSNTKLFIKGWV